jgi:uridine phosphorylase
MSVVKPSPLKHIRCVPGDIAPTVLLPGDPGRVKRIADQMDESHLVAENREYIVVTGMTKGVPVSVCSTGIGGPAASIALEELVKVGGKTFIRIGSAGGRQDRIPIGTPIILTAAHRGEGTSKAYLPAEFPAVADLDVTNALVKAARERGEPYEVGIGFTRDAFYVQDQALNQILKDAGVVAAEQEAALLYVLGSLRHVKVGAIVSTDSNINWTPQPTQEEKENLYKLGEKKVIAIALRAVQILAEQDL